MNPVMPAHPQPNHTLLAIPIGSAHDLSPRPRRIVYAAATAAGVGALVGGALIAAGPQSAGAVLVLVAMLSALVLLWVVRLANF